MSLNVNVPILLYFLYLGATGFQLGPYSITITAGSVHMEFDIPIYDNNLCEPNKTIPLFIGTSSLPDRVSIGNPGEAKVTIIDDDCEF